MASTHATLDGATRFLIDSEHVDQVFRIDVWQPVVSQGRLPVVYVLDGNSMFGMVAQSVGPMMFAGQLPPMVLVGVGYEVESPMEVVALRARDLLPTFVPGYSERLASLGLPVADGVEPGGADAFRAFLETELKPRIEAEYPVDATDQTLVGDSYGGTFATHVLFTEPSAFDRYLIGSPVLDWDGEILFRSEAELAGRTSALSAKLFFSAGALETKNNMIPLLERMVETIRARDYDGLEIKTYIFPDETHESVLGPTMSRGLRAVFGSWP